MMNWIYLVLYVLCSVSGSTLLKFGSSTAVKTLFTIPFLNLNISLTSLIGFISYGLSFVFYTILLSKFDLSFISPLKCRYIKPLHRYFLHFIFYMYLNLYIYYLLLKIWLCTFLRLFFIFYCSQPFYHLLLEIAIKL